MIILLFYFYCLVTRLRRDVVIHRIYVPFYYSALNASKLTVIVNKVDDDGRYF